MNSGGVKWFSLKQFSRVVRRGNNIESSFQFSSEVCVEMRSMCVSNDLDSSMRIVVLFLRVIIL